jgi:PAS domain S-box-containing protein
MKNNPAQLFALMNTIDGMVWEADADMQQFVFVSPQVQLILGYPPEEWKRRKGLWESSLHPDDAKIAESYRRFGTTDNKNNLFEYRMTRADGQLVWIKDNISVIHKANGTYHLCGIMFDNTVAERLRALEQLERDVLRLNSDLALPLTDVLFAYLRGLEALFPLMQCSIHRIRNRRLISGVSPSLPPDYVAAVIGLQIGENEGSCGTAAATGRQVIVSDIANDKRWEKYRSLALGYQLRACWSNPVIDAEGTVIATLAMYYQQPKIPSEEELQVMEKATALLRIILENRQKNEIINEAHLLMLQSQELAHFGNWRWDIQEDIVSWSPALYTIYGLDPHEFKATFAGYQERLHPDDRSAIRQTIETVLLTGEDAEFEERIIRPNGDLRYLRSWAKLKKDGQGVPLEMIGACLDITEKVDHIRAIEDRNRQLLEIAWMQSHVIRSPLTKIMALVELIGDTPDTHTAEKNELFGHLLASAQELDEQVRRINEKTEQET